MMDSITFWLPQQTHFQLREITSILSIELSLLHDAVLYRSTAISRPQHIGGMCKLSVGGYTQGRLYTQLKGE